MNRAEEAALKAYPVKQMYNIYHNKFEDVNIIARVAFQEGYGQAEKGVKDALLEWLENKVRLSYGVATDAFVEVIDKLKEY